MVCCWLTAVACEAQKKELSQARTYLKSGKDYDKAEKLMTDLLAKDSASRENKKVWLTWYQAVEKQYEAANEKLYLKQKYDTAQFFGFIHRMYLIAEGLDSLDARPDKKGRVRPEYRTNHAGKLDMLRRNLYSGGMWNVQKGNYETAYGYFDRYVDAARQPLFTVYDYDTRDTLLPQAAYWTVFCGYKLQRPDSTLRYSAQAMRDSSKVAFVLQFMSEAYRQQGDVAGWLATLHEGFNRYPEHPYFFPRLADYYTEQDKPDAVLALTEQGLREHADNQLFLLARSVVLLNTERYDECIEVSEHLIALNDTMPEPYFNVATVRLNQALALEEENEPRKNRGRLTMLYTQARPYMEAYRKLAPEDQKRWAPALYRIYLYLNMGKQFEEIDRLLNKMK